MNILKALEICKAERDDLALRRGEDYSGVEALTLLMSTMGELLNEMTKYAENVILYGTDHEEVRWLPNFRYGTHKSEKFFICSKCYAQNMEKSAYCPHCGEKMEE